MLARDKYPAYFLVIHHFGSECKADVAALAHYNRLPKTCGEIGSGSGVAKYRLTPTHCGAAGVCDGGE